MKFDPDPPEHDETAVDGATTPVPSSSAATEAGAAPEEPGLRGRYGRAIDDTRSSLEQLRAHAWDHYLRDEPQVHGGPNSPDGSEVWDGEGEGGALFRPDRLSGRARRTGGER